MARKKKRAWNMSNPLYRYLQKKKKANSKRVVKYKKIFSKGLAKAKRKRGVFMARRRTSRRRSGSMGGMGSLAKSGLMAIGAAEFANMIPINIPYKEEAVGAAAGAALGADGAPALGGCPLTSIPFRIMSRILK